MKELTTEEKAKAYDKALKVLHKYDGANIMFSQSLKEEMFPELKESEDDRIREEIIKRINLLKSATLSDLQEQQYNTWLGWLEKQGDIVKYYGDKLDRCACDYFNKGYKKALEKQGEHNAKFMEEQPANQKRKLDIEKAALSATGVIEQEEWFIKGAEWSDKNPSCISSENQSKQKEYTFKSLPRLLEMIEPSNRAKAYCQKLIDSLIEEGYPADAKIVGECLKQMNGEDVPMAVMDEKQCEQKTPNMDRIKEKAHQIAWENSKNYDPTLSKESWCEIAALEMAYWLEKQNV